MRLLTLIGALVIGALAHASEEYTMDIYTSESGEFYATQRRAEYPLMIVGTGEGNSLENENDMIIRLNKISHAYRPVQCTFIGEIKKFNAQQSRSGQVLTVFIESFKTCEPQFMDMKYYR